MAVPPDRSHHLATQIQVVQDFDSSLQSTNMLRCIAETPPHIPNVELGTDPDNTEPERMEFCPLTRQLGNLAFCPLFLYGTTSAS